MGNSNPPITEETVVCLIMHLKSAGTSMHKVYKDMAKSDPSRSESSFEHQFRSFGKRAEEWRKNGVPDMKNGGVQTAPTAEAALAAPAKGTKRGRPAKQNQTAKKPATKKAKVSDPAPSPTPENVTNETAVVKAEVPDTTKEELTGERSGFENEFGEYPTEWHPDDF